MEQIKKFSIKVDPNADQVVDGHNGDRLEPPSATLPSA